MSGWEPRAIVLDQRQRPVRIIASFSYDKTNSHHDVLGGENRGNWRFAERIDSGRVPNYYAPEYRYVTDRDQFRERWGGSLGVHFRPTDMVELSAQYFHSELTVDTREASLKFPFAQGEALGLQGPFQIDSNGVLQTGTMRAQSAEAISFVDVSEITSDNLQFAVEFDNDDNFRASAMATYSMADQFRDVA